MCDEGNSRSPTIASLLKYQPARHDTLSVGVQTASEATLDMLGEWADLVVCTSPNQRLAFPGVDDDRIMVWPVPDAFPRPFNPELRRLVLQLISEKGL